MTFKRASERDIAFVFQLFALYPHMNVRRNIAFPAAQCQGMPRAEIARRVEEAARILRIEHLLDRPVSGLSAGDRQRVALGRAIVREPTAFMMDEPLGALDAEFRHLMCGELRALHDRLKATTVYVTHDQLEAMAMADKIAVMNQGVIEQLGTAAGDLRPAGDAVRRRLHRLAADELPRLRRRARRAATGRSASTEPRSRCRSCAKTGRAASSCSACGRSTSASRATARLRGEVFGAEYLGTTQIVTVDTARGQVKARLPAGHQRRAAARRSA